MPRDEQSQASMASLFWEVLIVRPTHHSPIESVASSLDLRWQYPVQAAGWKKSQWSFSSIERSDPSGKSQNLSHDTSSFILLVRLSHMATGLTARDSGKCGSYSGWSFAWLRILLLWKKGKMDIGRFLIHMLLNSFINWISVENSVTKFYFCYC